MSSSHFNHLTPFPNAPGGNIYQHNQYGWHNVCTLFVRSHEIWNCASRFGCVYNFKKTPNETIQQWRYKLNLCERKTPVFISNWHVKTHEIYNVIEFT